MRRFFSVIVCTYNRADLLPRALDSLLAQSETDWEAIIIDDGSMDGTKEVVNRYSAICNRFKYFQRSINRGIAAARNIGIQLASGRFITFLDSDDEYAVNHLAVRKQILLSNPEVRMLHGGLRIIGNPLVADKNDPQKLIHLNDCEVGGTFVINQSVFHETGGFEDLDYAEDSHFYETASNRGIQCQSVKEDTYIYYRNTHGQVTSQIRDQNGLR